MKDAILIELATRWENEADESAQTDLDGGRAAEIENAKAKGRREGKRECADGIRILVSLLGET